MSYMCSLCTMSVRQDACEDYDKCRDGSECTGCGHLSECHAASTGLAVDETVALQVVTAFFSGQDVGIRRATDAFQTVAHALVMRAEAFRWGEHLINGPAGERGECSQCGAEFSKLLDDRGCSAVD